VHVSVYRDNARWGELVGEHRASAAQWFGAAALGAIITIALVAWVPGAKHPDPKLWIAMIVFPIMSAWMIVVGIGLTKIHLRVFERGLHFTDARAAHEAAWSDVTAVEERTNKYGTIMAVAVTVPTGTIVLPKELSRFADVRAQLDKHVSAPRTKVAFAPLAR
jgi:hypothetical protein